LFYAVYEPIAKVSENAPMEPAKWLVRFHTKSDRDLFVKSNLRCKAVKAKSDIVKQELKNIKHGVKWWLNSLMPASVGVIEFVTFYE